MCDECQILREHYPRDPEVRLSRVRLFLPNCIYCGARYIQWIQRMAHQKREDKPAACRSVLDRWTGRGHDGARIRALAKEKQWAVAPAPKGAKR